MDQIFFDTENLAKQKFPTYEPPEKLDSCEHNGHRYRKAGIATVQHGIGWRLVKLIETIAIAILSVFVRSYREHVGSLWDAAKTGCERLSVCVKYLPGEELSKRIQELQKTMSYTGDVKSFFEKASNEEIIELVKQSDAEQTSTATGEKGVDFRYIVWSTTPDKIPLILSGIGHDTNKLAQFFSCMPLSENVIPFLEALSSEQKNLFFSLDNPSLWKRTLPLFTESNFSSTLPPDFVDACRVGIKRAIDNDKFKGAITLFGTFDQDDLKGLYALVGPCESLGKYLNWFFNDKTDSITSDFIFISEKVFASKVTEIPELLLANIVGHIIHRSPALQYVNLSPEQMTNLKELIRNSCSNTNLELLKNSHIHTIFDTIYLMGIKNIPQCFESLSAEKLKSFMADYSYFHLTILDVLKANVSSQTDRERLFEVLFSSLPDWEFDSYLEYRNSPEDDYTLLEGCPYSFNDPSQENKVHKLILSIVDGENPEIRLSELMRKANSKQMFQLLLSQGLLHRSIPTFYLSTVFEAIVNDAQKFNDFLTVPSAVMHYLDAFLGLMDDPWKPQSIKNSSEGILNKLKVEILNRGMKNEIILLTGCSDAVKDFLNN